MQGKVQAYTNLALTFGSVGNAHNIRCVGTVGSWYKLSLVYLTVQSFCVSSSAKMESILEKFLKKP